MKRAKYLLCVAMVAVSLCVPVSCTQSEVDEEAQAEVSRGDQRALVLSLSEKYGLSVDVDAFLAPGVRGLRPFDADSLETLFAYVSSNAGEYEGIALGDSSMMFVKGGEINSLSVNRSPVLLLENFSGSFTESIGGLYGGTLVLEVSWSSGSVSGAPSVSVSVLSNLTDFPDSSIGIKIDRYEFVGINAFTFEGVISYYGSAFRQKLLGGYSNGRGSLSVSNL